MHVVERAQPDDSRNARLPRLVKGILQRKLGQTAPATRLLAHPNRFLGSLLDVLRRRMPSRRVRGKKPHVQRGRRKDLLDASPLLKRRLERQQCPVLKVEMAVRQDDVQRRVRRRVPDQHREPQQRRQGIPCVTRRGRVERLRGGKLGPWRRTADADPFDGALVLQCSELRNGSEHLPIAVPADDRRVSLPQPIRIRLGAERAAVIARRPRSRACSNELDVVHVHDIEVRRMQPLQTARHARADALRRIIERVPRVPEPTALCKLGVYASTVGIMTARHQ